MSDDPLTLDEIPGEPELPWDEPAAPPAESDNAARAAEVAVRQQEPLSVTPYSPTSASLTDLAGIARALAASGYFSDARDAAQAFAKILAGQELGIGPFRALKEVRIIQGAPTLSAGATAALIKASDKYDYREVERTNERCILDFYEHGEKVGTVTFTMEDADRAKLRRAGGGWDKYPRRMLFARAITEGATTYTPDVFGGAIYTPEELGAEGFDES